ncbi:ABC transporter substrate-binding protein [Herbaspirillum lusitanum]|uniref:ABC transporter substrate-binding protein n=1 Tax=Herbaspirillum lusitanum TaxID=213312 RepID=A0ABW9A881_9BURK
MDRRNFVKKVPLGVGGLLMSQWMADFARAAPAPSAMSLAIGSPVDVYSWDPTGRIAPAPVSIFKCVFDQPLEYSATSELQPGLVKAYRWLDKEGKILELEFRDDVLFHNGDKMTSEDFKYTFFDRPKKEKGVQLGAIWGGIVKVDTPSPTKAVVHLSYPFVTAPQYLAYTGAFILPKAYIEKVGTEGFIARPIGTGPYKLVEYQRDSRIVLQAWEKYWRGPATVQNLTIQVVKDPTARVSGVQSGQLALAYNLPIRDAVRLSTNANLTSQLTPTVDTYVIHMVNTGALTDANVRLAMHHAIDKQALSKAFFNGVAAPLATPAAPGTPAFDPDAKFAYDPEQSRALLAKSGFSVEKPVSFRFFATNGVYPNDFDMARAIVQMWKKVGINASLEAIELSEYFPKVQSGKLEGPALWLWANATGDPELAAGAYLNPKMLFSVWRSNDVSAQLDPLLVEMDYKKRMEGYKQFHKWVVDQGYALPLVQGVSSVVYGKKPGGYVPFRNGWILPYYWKPVTA